jgi:hypothetical protein
MLTLSSDQLNVIHSPIEGTLFLQGPAGSGKTTAGLGRLRYLLDSGIPAEEILILVSQRTLAIPYYEALRQPDFPAGGTANIVTLSGLARRLVELFWPMAAQLAGFAHPRQPPTFLNLETSQYFLARLVSPLLEQGYFESIHLDRNRLLSQVLDNLNKAAGVGFPYTSLAERLKAAWVGEPAQFHIYEQAQECATLFRQYCLQHNLLDFSLQLEMFVKTLWPSLLCRQYLFSTYRHLIYDNLEEDVPVVHDVVREWLPHFDSALLIYDSEGGFRSFLGADPNSGFSLSEASRQVVTFSGSWITSPALETSRQVLIERLNRKRGEAPVTPQILEVMKFSHQRFYPQMADWVAQQVSQLVNKQGVLPGEIAVLAPFMSDSLRFTLMDRLEGVQVPARSHRPSRSLREEPATNCLLTLAKLAHPTWKCNEVKALEVRYALMQAIAGLDLVRANLLAQIVFHEHHCEENLGSFDDLQTDLQERITFSIGERFEVLRKWLIDYRSQEPLELDIFLSRLFGEVLSQPGFGFHDQFDAAAVTARLIDSVRNFRWGTALPDATGDRAAPMGQEYIRMVEEGVVAAQYLQSWMDVPEDTVLIAPAYTFLMANRPVDIQFWLDAGSSGWWERLYQPLTHPYVLSRNWTGKTWTDVQEYQANQEAMLRLTSGLLRRCRNNIYICTTGLNEQGAEQRGPLLQAVQGILRVLSADEEGGAGE